MEDWFVPEISLYRFANATFELRVHLHLSNSAHAARLTAENIELIPHGDQLLISGSVIPHVEGYCHGYPYNRGSIPQGTLVWTDQPCGRFGRSVDLGLAPGTEYVILDRRVECGDYVIQYTLRNKPSLATNSCVNMAAYSHDPGAHYSSFHQAHVYNHPLSAKPNTVPCTPYPAETLGVNATHLPGVTVGGGTHAGARFVDGIGVGFNAGYGQQETETTATAQGQTGCYTFAGAGAGIGVGVTAGIGVGFGAGQAGSSTAQTTLLGTGQPGQAVIGGTTLVGGADQTGQVVLGETTLEGGGQTGQVPIGETRLEGTGQATFVGSGQPAGQSMMTSTSPTGVMTGHTTSATTQVTGDGGTGQTVGTLVGTAQTPQASTSASNSTEIDGSFGIGAGFGGIESAGAGVGGSIGMSVGAGAVGTSVGTSQTTQTSTSASNSTEVDGEFGIGVGLSFSGGVEIGSTGVGVGGAVSMGAVMGTRPSAALAEASSSGQCGQVAAKEMIISAKEEVQRGRGVLVWSSSEQQNAGISTAQNTESSTEKITEPSTQQVSQASASASAEVDVEIGRGRRSTGTHVTFADQEETFGEYNSGRVSAQQGQAARKPSSTLDGTEQTSESLTQQGTQTSSSSEVDAPGGGRVSEQTQVQGQGVDVLVQSGSENMGQESSVGVVERDSERIVTDVKASMEEDVRTQGSVQPSTSTESSIQPSTTESSTQLSTTESSTQPSTTESSTQPSTTESSTQPSTTESSVTATSSEAPSTQQQGTLSQIQVEEASGSRRISQNEYSGTDNMEVGTSQEPHQGSMPEISQNSTKEIDQYESEAESSTTRDVAQAAGLEAVTSSPKGAQTAIQDSSTVIGSSSTTGIGISENDDGRGAQSSTGILDSSAELDVQSSRVQGSLEGKNVEGHSADVQERGFTTSATAAVGGRVDPTVVSELEGGIQTGLSTEATGTAITSATAHQTEQEPLIGQTQKITEGISGEDSKQISGNSNDSGSDHEGSSVHSDNWHVVSGPTDSIKTPMSANQDEAVASSEQTLNESSGQQFQSVGPERHTDISHQPLAVSSEQRDTPSQETCTASPGETRISLPEHVQDVSIPAELLHSIHAQWSDGSVRK